MCMYQLSLVFNYILLFYRELTGKNVKSLPSSDTSSEMSTLCSNIISLLEDCMSYDEQQYTKQCVDIAQNLLTKLDKQV